MNGGIMLEQTWETQFPTNSSRGETGPDSLEGNTGRIIVDFLLPFHCLGEEFPPFSALSRS